MKTIKRVLAIILMAAMILTLSACSSKSALKNLLNDDYSPSYTLLTKNSKLNELNGYSIDNSNGYLATFVRYNGMTQTYKVYSFEANRVISSYTNTDNTMYSISLVEGAAAYILQTTDRDSDTFSTKITYSLYDGTGDLKEKSDDTNEVDFIYAQKLFLFNNAVYEVDENGNISKKMDILSYMNVPTVNGESDGYYYDIADDSVTVYAKDLTALHYWDAPEYAENMSAFILSNGNVFIQ